ncbi:hypothetical protein F66182_7437 [Fusarium sp. NRRL 66182]|nr:hypothetical protein F66182_7437 [Fusarium sp. NRRL 66182]
MSSADESHLTAMGLPVPSYAPAHPVPLRRAILNRAEALRVDTLWDSMTPALYNFRHNRMRRAGRRRFAAARRQHKLMQRWQNDLAGQYRRRVRTLVRQAPPDPIWNSAGHRDWLLRFLANGGVPLLERERLASLAEETAVYAIEQGEKHHRLLKKWKWGYSTLVQRRLHEEYARQAGRAATD